MATEITLAAYGTSLILRGTEEPYKNNINLNQLVQETLGGQPIITKLGRPFREFELNIVHMSDAEWASLDNFICNIIDGSRRPFTYTEWTGVIYTQCYYIEGLETHARENHANNSVVLQFKKIIQ